MTLTLKQNDTWPPLRGRAADENGPLPLVSADSIKVLIKSTTTLITGTAAVIDPPDVDGFNWEYTWDADDLDIANEYRVELEITWDANSTPPRVETVPNSGSPRLTIEADLG